MQVDRKIGEMAVKVGAEIRDLQDVLASNIEDVK